jgi:hypothetical protein
LQQRGQGGTVPTVTAYKPTATMLMRDMVREE